MTNKGKGKYHNKTIEVWKELGVQTGSEESLSQDQLDEVTYALERYTIDTPTLEDSRRLMNALSAARNYTIEHSTRKRELSTWNRLLRIMRVVRSQTRLLSLPFWLISAFIMLLGGWSGIFVKANMVQPLIFIVPAVAAIGVCAAFRSYGTPMFRLELSLPISPAQLIYGRLLLIVGYNVLLALAASLLVDSPIKEIGILIVNWLIPLGVSSLVALTAMLYMKLSSAVITSLLVWSVQLLLNDKLGVFYLFSRYQDGWAMSKIVGCSLIVALALLVQWKIARIQKAGGV
jgi:hypothetical protein